MVLVRITPQRFPMTFHITLETAEDGWIVAECPALPGCVSQGKDEQEAINNIREAITAWMWAEDQKAVKSLPENLDLLTRRRIEASTITSRRELISTESIPIPPTSVHYSWCMGTLASISGKEAVKAFTKAGWQTVGQVGSHLVM